MRLQGAAQVFDELFVAVWCFDENLRLMFDINAFFEHFELLRTCIFIDGQITVERKTLSVEAARHERQQDARWSHQRHHFNAFLLCQRHHIGAGVGYGRAARLADDADIATLQQWFEIGADLFGRGVLGQFEETQCVDVDSLVHLLQKTACCAHILHDEHL